MYTAGIDQYPNIVILLPEIDKALDKVGDIFMNNPGYKLFPEIDKIIFNKPATIVLFNDGTKSVVKCSEETEFNPYYGVTCAIAKRIFGNNSSFKKIIAKKSNISDILKGKDTIRKSPEIRLHYESSHDAASAAINLREIALKNNCCISFENILSTMNTFGDCLRFFKEYGAMFSKNEVLCNVVSVSYTNCEDSGSDVLIFVDDKENKE